MKRSNTSYLSTRYTPYEYEFTSLTGDFNQIIFSKESSQESVTSWSTYQVIDGELSQVPDESPPEVANNE